MNSQQDRGSNPFRDQAVRSLLLPRVAAELTADLQFRLAFCELCLEKGTYTAKRSDLVRSIAEIRQQLLQELDAEELSIEELFNMDCHVPVHINVERDIPDPYVPSRDDDIKAVYDADWVFHYSGDPNMNGDTAPDKFVAGNQPEYFQEERTDTSDEMWDTMCDDAFNDSDAKVLCSQSCEPSRGGKVIPAMLIVFAGQHLKTFQEHFADDAVC